ncbi:3-isopropylmalate dehydratase [Pelomyxa schiedti]|nr:3-isopropylmalate dehydratase [Pelomyxa schiedti]
MATETAATPVVNKVWKYGNNVNTDQLFPGKYTYTCSKAPDILPHLLEDLDPTFAKNVKRGDILFVGDNFGCGSSREQPALGLYHAGIKCIVGKSFARIFYRAAINQGLILIECAPAVDAFTGTEEVNVDIEGGTVSIAGKAFTFPRLPPQILAIRDAGGLLEYNIAKLRAKKAAATGSS